MLGVPGSLHFARPHDAMDAFRLTYDTEANHELDP